MKCLNEVFVYFFKKAVNGRKFERALDGKLGQACLANDATKEKFQIVWSLLQELTKKDRKAIYDFIIEKQPQFNSLLRDTRLAPPCLSLVCNSTDLLGAIKALGEHLYYRTTTLQAIINASGETLLEHYQKYTAFNTNMCKACGTQKLSHELADTADDQQWRADYDHILVRSKYPIYSVHPDNFMPLCNICNQKAKSSKDILIDDNSRRTASFNPYDNDVCESYIEISLIESSESILPVINIKCSSSLPEIQDKYNNWNQTYRVPERVIGEKGDYLTSIENEILEKDLESFKVDIHQRAQENKKKQYSREWWFWDERLFKWIVDNQQEEIIWEMLQQRLASANENNGLYEEFEI